MSTKTSLATPANTAVASFLKMTRARDSRGSSAARRGTTGSFSRNTYMEVSFLSAP